MLIKRALWIAVLTYVFSFIIGGLAALGFGVDLNAETGLPTSVWILSIILTSLLAFVMALWYFKAKGTTPNFIEGLKLGGIFVLLGAIFEGLLIIPYAITFGLSSDLLNYYADPLFALSLILFVFFPALAGYLKEHKYLGSFLSFL